MDSEVESDLDISSDILDENEEPKNVESLSMVKFEVCERLIFLLYRMYNHRGYLIQFTFY